MGIQNNQKSVALRSSKGRSSFRKKRKGLRQAQPERVRKTCPVPYARWGVPARICRASSQSLAMAAIRATRPSSFASGRRERKSVAKGKRVSVRVDLACRRIIKKKRHIDSKYHRKQNNYTTTEEYSTQF